MTDSIFNRGGSGKTRGGLDRFLGPKASDYSHVPENLTDGVDDTANEAPEADCKTNPEQPICELGKAAEAQRKKVDD